MTNKKLYLSSTSIKTYLTCKKRFKLKHIDKLSIEESTTSHYMSFGNSMHMTLADYNMIADQKYKTLEVLHNLLRKNWISEGYSNIEEEKIFGQKGLEMLTNYYDFPQDHGSKNLIIEKMIFKDCDSFTLCGKLDKVYEDDSGEIEILDYKTGQTISGIDQLQLPIYLILAESRLNYYPSKISLYYLTHNKKITQSVDESLITRSTNHVLDICSKIANETSYEACPSSYCSTNCEYYETCEEAKDENIMVINSLRELSQAGKLSTVF